MKVPFVAIPTVFICLSLCVSCNQVELLQGRFNKERIDSEKAKETRAPIPLTEKEGKRTTRDLKPAAKPSGDTWASVVTDNDSNTTVAMSLDGNTPASIIAVNIDRYGSVDPNENENEGDLPGLPNQDGSSDIDGDSNGSDDATTETTDATPGTPGNGSDATKTDTTGTTGLDSNHATLTWTWNCAGVTAKRNDVVSTTGKVRIDVVGQVCEDDQQAQDVLFIVDVSQSNDSTDRLTYNSCGRLKAVQAVVDKMAASTATRFALITFAADIVETSPVFLSPLDFRDRYVTADVLCRARGMTSYDIPIVQGTELFQDVKNHENLDRQGLVYFISDGKPSASHQGIEEAKGLRSMATVVTLLLQNHHVILRDFIASRDANDAPFHTQAEDAESMVRIFQGYAEAHFSKMHFAYKIEESGSWFSKNYTTKVHPDTRRFSFSLGDVLLPSPRYLAGRQSLIDSVGITRKRDHIVLW